MHLRLSCAQLRERSMRDSVPELEFQVRDAIAERSGYYAPCRDVVAFHFRMQGASNPSD